MRLAELLQSPEAKALLRYQEENPWERQARLIFTDYLRDHDLEEIAECVGRSLEESDAALLPDGAQYVYDGWARTPEFEIAQGVRMKFCWIPAGKALLGSPLEEKNRSADEQEHKYETKGFWLGKYPVVQEQWKAIMDNEPSHFKGAQLPVEKVSWEDCQQFLAKCTVQGWKIRLPQEDEWEYACRGGLGNQQPFYWGDTLNGDMANCYGMSPYGTATQGTYLQKTTEVGSYEKLAPQPWGVCDMHGNVWEWCENWHTRKDATRVQRGGSWLYDSHFCRAARRCANLPNARDYSDGFRVCLALD